MGGTSGALYGLGLAGRPARRFVVVFLGVAALLLAVYYYPYAEGGLVKRAVAGYLHGYAVLSGTILRRFDPTVTVVGNDIIGRYSLRLVRTCDAMDVNILLVSAVLAWPGTWRRRILAAFIGLTCILVANVARICTLYDVGVNHPASFELVHVELWPIAMLAVAVGTFVVLARWMQPRAPGGAR